MRKNFKNIDIFAKSAATQQTAECAMFDSAEQIKVKQVYTA